VSQNIAKYYKKKVKRNKMISEILTTGFWLAMGTGVIVFGLTMVAVGFAMIRSVFS
jgi:hypothetical protein